VRGSWPRRPPTVGQVGALINGSPRRRRSVPSKGKSWNLRSGIPANLDSSVTRQSLTVDCLLRTSHFRNSSRTSRPAANGTISSQTAPAGARATGRRSGRAHAQRLLDLEPGRRNRNIGIREILAGGMSCAGVRVVGSRVQGDVGAVSPVIGPPVPTTTPMRAPMIAPATTSLNQWNVIATLTAIYAAYAGASHLTNRVSW
jgi:hypothetical protein